MARKKKKANPSQQFANKYYTAERPSSYSGMTAFLKGVPPARRASAKDWLETQDAYALHRPALRKFKRRKIIANFQDQLQTDLIDLVHIAGDNDKNRYLLTVIEVFSKKAYVEILSKKDTATVATAFEKILDRLDFKPRVIHSDQGSEFVGSKFQALLKRRGIKYFSSTDSSIKAAIIERFNRTLMGRLYRYFTKHNSYRYIEILPNIIKSYNSSVHSATGVAPNKVSHHNKEIIWNRVYNRPPPKESFKSKQLKVGSYVRIAKRFKTFDKGYKSKWSGEIFVINKIIPSNPKTYALTDLLNERILGSFYEQELTPTIYPKSFAIESILDSKKDKLLIKWRDYPPKFNSWEDKKSISNI